MKKMLLLLLFSSFVFGQNNFRLSKNQIDEISKINPDIAKNALMVEKMLSGEYKPTFSIINQAINRTNAKEKDLERVRKIICISCYEDEWNNKQNIKEIHKIKSDSIFINDVPSSEIYALKLKEVTPTDAKIIGNDIFSISKRKYVYFTTLSDENLAILIYFPENLTKEQMQKDIDTRGSWCNLCAKVNFKIYRKGEDIALEKKGEEKYRFESAFAPLLDLFPWWQKHFFSNAIPEDITNYKNHIFQNDRRNIYLKFSGSDERWVIQDFR